MGLYQSGLEGLYMQWTVQIGTDLGEAVLPYVGFVRWISCCLTAVSCKVLLMDSCQLPGTGDGQLFDRCLLPGTVS